MPEPVRLYCVGCDTYTPHSPGGDPLRMYCGCGETPLKPIEQKVCAAIMDLDQPDSVDITSHLQIRADLIMESLSELVRLGYIERISRGIGYYYNPV